MQRPIGDIRNFPRKDSLETDIANTVKDVYETPVTIERIIIFGSWGAGTAKPFRSDLDTYVVVSNPMGDELDPDFEIEIEKRQPQLLSTDVLNNRYAMFDDADVIVKKTTTSVEEIMIIALMDNEQPKAYDLTNRKDIVLNKDTRQLIGF